MHSIHLNDLHVSKGPNLFALSVGALVCFGLALFFFLVSWSVGGAHSMDGIGGNYTLAILLLGVVIGAVFTAITKPKP